MIRNTLEKTKQATFSIVIITDAGIHSTATGFFVSPDGWLVTAAHVVTGKDNQNQPFQIDMSKSWLMQVVAKGDFKIIYTHLSVEYVDQVTDFALLKVDWEANREKESLKNKTGFPFIEVSCRDLGEGEPVYACGYPLTSLTPIKRPGVDFCGISLCPRVTSAIVSSTYERTEMIEADSDPKKYVLDKALNYGNSGGPILATETGKVHALCSGFQPVPIPQPHLDHLLAKETQPFLIQVPSLYGVVSSLGNPKILETLKDKKIPISQS